MANELYRQVLDHVNHLDPLSLFKHGVLNDEYEAEATNIVKLLPEAKSVQHLHDLIYNVFVHWFDIALVGPKTKYQKLAADLWQIKNDKSI